MKYIFGFFFILNSFLGSSQTNELLLGKWKYKGMYEMENFKLDKSAGLDMFYGDLSFYFDENNRYKGLYCR